MAKLNWLPATLAVGTVAGVAVDWSFRRVLLPSVHSSAVEPGDSARIFVPGPTIATSAPGHSGPETWLRVAVVLIILGAALWVILSKKYDDADRKWAYGAVGAILGYVIGSST